MLGTTCVVVESCTVEREIQYFEKRQDFVSYLLTQRERERERERGEEGERAREGDREV